MNNKTLQYIAEAIRDNYEYSLDDSIEIVTNSFLPELLEEMPDVGAVILMTLKALPMRISLGMIVCLPFVLVTYWGLLMLFDLKAPKWHPGFVIFTLWLISLVAFCVLTVLKIPDLGLWM